MRDQCQAAGVPFLFKQHGEWLAKAFCGHEKAEPDCKQIEYIRQDGSIHDRGAGVDLSGAEAEVAWVGKKAAGRLLDGCEWNETPKSTA